MRKITLNSIKCNLCGEIITSLDRHDYVRCKCGSCSVDGGTDYLKRSFTNSVDDYTELSEYRNT